MTITLSAITGGAQTGFTTPGYTPTVDFAPTNAKQWAITALTGTQAGVTSHSASSPFTVTWIKPANYRMLGQPNPVTGRVKEIPMNRSQLLVRKGTLPLAGQPYVVSSARVIFDVAAGADTADPANLRALISCLIGALNQMSAGIGDTVVTGVVG